MLNLLFIDDEPEALVTLWRFFDRKKNAGDIDYRRRVCTFSEAKEQIPWLRPDIVVLDLLLGGSEPEGGKTCGFIWEKHFCPVIIYSAFPDRLDDMYDGHPFIQIVKKGRGSPARAFEAVRKFNPHIQALRKAQEEVRQSFSSTMRDLAPRVFGIHKPDARVDIITRAGRRRLAAMLDQPSADDDTLASWEVYLFPPVSADLQLGDILQDSASAADDPASFRVLLTPSCDLVASGGRTPKTDKALAARCLRMTDALGLAGFPGIRPIKIKKELPASMLSHGYSIPIIPFPKLDGIVPTMAANLRDLELIPLTDIGAAATYRPVASIDSPFREMIAWAYLQTAGRPALPDRDLKAWANEIAAAVTPEGDGA